MYFPIGHDYMFQIVSTLCGRIHESSMMIILLWTVERCDFSDLPKRVKQITAVRCILFWLTQWEMTWHQFLAIWTSTGGNTDVYCSYVYSYFMSFLALNWLDNLIFSTEVALPKFLVVLHHQPGSVWRRRSPIARWPRCRVNFDGSIKVVNVRWILHDFHHIST